MKRSWVASLFILSLAAGAAAGLFYAWQLDPVTYTNAEPSSLHALDKVTYLALIADRYAAGGDLEMAKRWLDGLGVAADGAALARFIEAHLTAGGEPEQVRHLAHLALALGGQGGVLQVFAPTATPSPVVGTVQTTAPTPSSPGTRFQLMEETALCAPPGREGLVHVWVMDRQGQPLAGVELAVVGSAGGSSFFTGLKPEQGTGYADLQLGSEGPYDVGPAAPGSDLAMGLRREVPPGRCPTTTLGLEWRLTFQQP